MQQSFTDCEYLFSTTVINYSATKNEMYVYNSRGAITLSFTSKNINNKDLNASFQHS